jgi:hypothetical protein
MYRPGVKVYGNAAPKGIFPRCLTDAKPGIPSSMHEKLVNDAIDNAVVIRNTLDSANNINALPKIFAFRQDFEVLSYLLEEYKKLPHEEPATPASAEKMDTGGDKKSIIARCNLTTGPKGVSPSLFRSLNFSAEISRFPRTPR